MNTLKAQAEETVLTELIYHSSFYKQRLLFAASVCFYAFDISSALCPLSK